MLFPIIGPSGSGKTTLLRELRKQIPELQLLESVTTRRRRESDLEGEYRYVSNEEFDAFEKNGAFCWTAGPYGNRYGTRELLVNAALVSRKIYAPILTVDTLPKLIEYARRNDMVGSVKPIYLAISNEIELWRRLAERGEAPENIRKRIGALAEEFGMFYKLEYPIRVIDAFRPVEEVFAEAYQHIMQERPR